MDLLELNELCTKASRQSAQLDPGLHSDAYFISSTCTYYHYLCDGIDDVGWGCGYRSLQSLCSWAARQRKKGKQPAVQEGGRKDREDKVKEELVEGGGWKGRQEGGWERGKKILQEGNREGESKEALEVGEMETREDRLQKGGPECFLATSHAGYSSVPSLRDIQEALVELGDKPLSFIGSREWIGSFEACLVLDYLYGVVCKMVHVSSGGDVLGQVETLATHFQTVGSPVMIGGDVDGASKTLIGVLIPLTPLGAPRSRDARFLIADPHYSGPASVDVVVSGGHVQWHGLQLFHTASFYNFCLPQKVTPQ